MGLFLWLELQPAAAPGAVPPPPCSYGARKGAPVSPGAGSARGCSTIHLPFHLQWAAGGIVSAWLLGARRSLPTCIFGAKSNSSGKPGVQQVCNKWEWVAIAGNNATCPARPHPSLSGTGAAAVGLCPSITLHPRCLVGSPRGQGR